MNSVWYSLLWKEWREHRGWIAMLAAATVLLLPLHWLGERGHRWPDYLWGIMIIAVPMISLFLGAGIAAGEQSQRTIGFLQSLPVRTTRPAIAKLLLALLTVWAPCVAFLAVLQFWDWQGVNRNQPVPFEWTVIGYGLAASSLLIWMAAAGVNLSDEVRAGAVGLLIILMCWAVLALAIDRWLIDALERMLVAAAPAGVATIFLDLADRSRAAREGNFHSYSAIWPPIVASAVTHGALVTWYVIRFGRAASTRPQRIEALARPEKVTWLAPPRRWPWSAILWKQTRETLPLAALGAGAILCMAIVLAAALRTFYGQRVSGVEFSQMAGTIWMMTGFCVSVVAGIGLFLDDLRPGLHTFWRSRPIDPNQWFVVKFAPSLLMTVVTLAAPAVLVCGVALAIYGRGEGLTPEELQDLVRVFGLSLLVQTAVFCVAAAMMAVVRRPVYAALFTILTAIVATMCLTAIQEDPGLSVAVVATVVALMAMTAMVAAWLAVRNDWGWNP